MKRDNFERKQHYSLMFTFLGIILAVVLAIIVVVGLFTILMLYLGILKLEGGQMPIGSFILCLIAGTLIIGTFMAWGASLFILKPINKILNSLHSLASGNYSSRLYFKGPFSKLSTIRELTDSFNTMASELEHTEMMRSDFINNFSHEFKTPIVSIAGFAKLLKRGNLNEEQVIEYLDIIEEESLRLSQMATNVLSLTKVENQSILSDVAPFNLSEQLRTSVLLLEKKWTRKHLELSLPIDEYYFNGNEELLIQVWINLFDNAIKFSQEYGVLEAKIDKTENNTYVYISNFGDPIPEESMEKIFNKFYQADESHSTEGNGVGLAIVKKIVDLHHGNVTSACRDGKTTFSVILPNV